jgi:hypothetical protein
MRDESVQIRKDDLDIFQGKLISHHCPGQTEKKLKSVYPEHATCMLFMIRITSKTLHPIVYAICRLQKKIYSCISLVSFPSVLFMHSVIIISLFIGILRAEMYKITKKTHNLDDDNVDDDDKTTSLNCGHQRAYSCYNRFLPRPFQFIVHNISTIQCCIPYAIQEVIKTLCSKHKHPNE